MIRHNATSPLIPLSASHLVLSVALLLTTPKISFAQDFEIYSLPTGLQPVGIDTERVRDAEGEDHEFVVVANSGEDSISYYEIIGFQLVQPLGKVEGIPRPYGVAFCGAGQAIISSPMDNSVSVIKFPEGTVLGKLMTGTEPYSVDCVNFGTEFAVVSNYGDSSVTVINMDTLQVIGQMPSVPGSKGWRGVAAYRVSGSGIVSQPYALIAGTDADVVTVINVLTLSVLAQIPATKPSGVLAGLIMEENSLVFFDRNTLAITSRLDGVSGVQDFVVTDIGLLATLEGSDQIWRWPCCVLGPDPTLSFIDGIPGPAAMVRKTVNNVPTHIAGITLVTSPVSNSLYTIIPPPGGWPLDFRVVNGAHCFADPLQPGTLVSGFQETGAQQAHFAQQLPLPRTLGGVSVRVGGDYTFDITEDWVYSPVGSIEAPLLFVGPTQVNFQIPSGITVSSHTPVELTRADGSRLLGNVDTTRAGPGLFTLFQNGQGQAAALNQDNSLNGNPEMIAGTQPAQRGSVIQIFGTGAGETDPPLLPGESAPSDGVPLVSILSQPVVTIGGHQSVVRFSGMAPGFVGLWQINAEIPLEVEPGDGIPLQVTLDGIPSNTVEIAVE